MNPLAKAVRDYLALRRGLGFKLVRHEAGLQEFASFLARKRSSHITVALALELATRHAHQKPAEWAARLSIVRGFAVTGAPRIRRLKFHRWVCCLIVRHALNHISIPTMKSGSCWGPPRLDHPLTSCVAGPTTVYSDCWLLRACGWGRR